MNKDVSTASTDLYCIYCSSDVCQSKVKSLSCSNCIFDEKNQFCFSSENESSLTECKSCIYNELGSCSCNIKHAPEDQ